MTVSSAGCMTMGTACDLKSNAIALIQRGDGMASSSTTKSADAWQGFYTALMSLKSCSHPSCGTPSTAMTEASLSEIGSSHGSSSPRKFGGDIEMEDDASDTDMSDMDPAEEDSDLVPSPSSKRGRRRNRRRRTRGGRRSAARRARLRAAHSMGCDKIDEEPASDTAFASLPSRDVVLLSDLGFESPHVTGGCQAQSKMPITIDSPGPSCSSKTAPDVFCTSARPCNSAGVDTGGETTYDASARVPAPTSLLTTSPQAMTSPCCVRAQFSAHTGSATWPVEPSLQQHAPNLMSATPTTQERPNGGTQLLPNGSCAFFFVSPCHAWAASSGGLVTTSPMTAPGGPYSVAPAGGTASTPPMMAPAGPCAAAPAGSVVSPSPTTAPGGPCSMPPAGGIMSTSPTTAPGGLCSSASVAVAGAGSRSADILRSWLQASGLPPAADIVAQLQAAAPEFYED
mmetsp:Transcript_150545/g.273939  ORF Transcript_150545/g.273939 Transcript_150545/m.273939 type:complete len:455 (-) Transcript_150545:155-1519(-)